jgi:TIR domain-containing protein
MANIFFSYARDDRDRAELLAHALQSQGWSVWWDRTIPAGQAFDEVIEKELDKARCVVVLWSTRSVASEWVRTEAQEGENRLILVPVLLDKVRIPLAFRRLQAADLTGWQGDKTAPEYSQLIADISAVLAAGSSSKASSSLSGVDSEAIEPVTARPGEGTARRHQIEERRRSIDGEVPSQPTFPAHERQAPPYADKRTEKPFYRKWSTVALGLAGTVLILILGSVGLVWLSDRGDTPQVPDRVTPQPAATVSVEPVKPAESSDGQTSRPEPSVNGKAVELGRTILSNLDKTRNTGPPELFDYWPDCGIRNAYYHLATFAGYEALVRLSPYPVFVSGPHGSRELNLNSQGEFGHYNPEFLRWLDVQLSELLKDRDFVRQTTPLFRSYLDKTVRTYWATYKALNEHPGELKTLIRHYELGINQTRLLKETFAWTFTDQLPFLRELSQNDNFDSNVVAVAVYFWLRRHLDGTHAQIFSMLDSVMRNYHVMRRGSANAPM